MNNIIFLLFILFPGIGFSQQFLWSTTKINDHDGIDVKIISLASVSDIVFDYYNSSEYYRDLTGFSKIGFERFLKESPSFANLIKWNSSLLTVDSAAFAFKGNNGRGSVISVVLVQNENVDIISFTSQYQSDYNHLISKHQFKKWLSSFWHYEVKLNEAETFAVGYDDISNFTNRGYLIRPNIVDKSNWQGVVVVEVTVNRQGKVLHVRPGVKGTTVSSPELFKECERAFLEAQFNPVVDGPERQVGYVTINFKRR